MEKQALWVKTTILKNRQNARQKLLKLMESNSTKEWILLEEVNIFNYFGNEVVQSAEEFPRFSRFFKLVASVAVGIGISLLIGIATVALCVWIDSTVIMSWINIPAVMLSVFSVIKALECIPDYIEDRWGNLKILGPGEYCVRTKNIPILIRKIDKDIVRLNKKIAELEIFYEESSQSWEVKDGSL